MCGGVDMKTFKLTDKETQTLNKYLGIQQSLSTEQSRIKQTINELLLIIANRCIENVDNYDVGLNLQTMEMQISPKSED